MARSVTVTLIDDIDHSPAAETVHFAVDGTAYQIDLSARHASELRCTLGRYITAARTAAQPPAPAPQQRRPRTQTDREQSRRIRSWAMGQGLLASPRGRIPQHVTDQYHATMRVPPTPARPPGAAGPQPASRASRTTPESRHRAPGGSAAGDNKAV